MYNNVVKSREQKKKRRDVFVICFVVCMKTQGDLTERHPLSVCAFMRVDPSGLA